MRGKLILLFLVLLFISGCARYQINNFDECIAAGNPVMESYPRQCSDDGKTFTEVLDVSELCKIAEGNWLEDFSECEGIGKEECSAMRGVFNECGSACRHSPDGTICTTQCVPFCSFE